MRICIIGAGHMGAWLAEELCLDHEVAVYDIDRAKLKSCSNGRRFLDLHEVGSFKPELMINAVSLHNTYKAFEDALPFLPEDCILCDIASVKTGFYAYYKGTGRRFVSTHPMFGPTFANIRDPRDENAIIIKESDKEGKGFLRDFYQRRHVNTYEYSFEEHDKTMAYCLSIPFASSMVFAACMKNQEAPGTTFRKHREIARGLLSKDDHLVAEIMFNPYTVPQIEDIHSRLGYLAQIIRDRDYEKMRAFLERLRNNVA